MASSSFAWRDLTIGADTGHNIVSIEGWEGLPPARVDKQNRTRGHGSHPSPAYADERTVTITGTSYSAAARDALLAQLEQSMAFGDPTAGEEPLAITLAGRTLTASAQLLRFSPAVAAGTWNYNLLGWVAQWRCTDPLRYGPQQLASTSLPTTGAGGLTYPLAYPLDYGTAGNTGQLTLTNDGTAPAPIRLTAVGALPQGFSISAVGTGQAITYPQPHPAQASLNIDTGAGTALYQGTSDRRAKLTSADWIQVPRRTAAGPGQVTLQFVSLGGAYDPNARLFAVWSSASW